jgi:hypothetical protein
MGMRIPMSVLGCLLAGYLAVVGPAPAMRKSNQERARPGRVQSQGPGWRRPPPGKLDRSHSPSCSGPGPRNARAPPPGPASTGPAIRVAIGVQVRSDAEIPGAPDCTRANPPHPQSHVQLTIHCHLSESTPAPTGGILHSRWRGRGTRGPARPRPGGSARATAATATAPSESRRIDPLSVSLA